MANRPELKTFKTSDGETLACRVREGKITDKSWREGTAGFFSLTGLMSEMDGHKAIETDRFAKARGLASVRFDYFGHGASTGAFEDGTISRWLEDALGIFDEFTDGPQILVGSSLGGWLALLLTLARPEQVKGLVLIAPSPDFTEEMLANLPPEAEALFAEGKPWPRPSDYGDAPYLISKGLLEDGKKHLLMNGPIEITQPVRILHGMKDADVPWQRSLDLVGALAGDDVSLRLIKDGDHRLSEAGGLKALSEALKDILDG